MSTRRLAIELSGLHKSYRVPVHRVETFKERVLHPFRSVEYSELKALEDISFGIEAGEFFGIAGRNGSGKTTLLKLLASIYKADSGTIRMAGRVAPFIELGVGFNPDLAARDNILLNGVMMGLGPKQARERADRVIEFAELEEFVELKLKNYSSGMRVRLGFAMLVEADADILLIDEVLAVGDAAFQQKCTDTFYRFKDEGRTIVLVTHAMEKLNEYCDRAALLHEGHLESIGDPEVVGDRYLELNFKTGRDSDRSRKSEEELAGSAGEGLVGSAGVVDFWFEDESGARTGSFRHGERIRFCAEIEALERLDGLCFGLLVTTRQGVHAVHLRTQVVGDSDRPLEPDERLTVRGTMDNLLGSDRYSAHIGLTRHVSVNDAIDMRPSAANFLIYGAEAPGGHGAVVSPDHEFSVERAGARELAPR